MWDAPGGGAPVRRVRNKISLKLISLKPAPPRPQVEKGTQGIDCRVFNPAARGQQVTVITLGRAGEDNKSFRLNDIDSTISGFAIADYGIQDAVQSGTQTTRTREVAGQVRWLGRRRRFARF